MFQCVENVRVFSLPVSCTRSSIQIDLFDFVRCPLETHLPLQTPVRITYYSIEANLFLVFKSPYCITDASAMSIKESRILMFLHQTRNAVKRWLREHHNQMKDIGTTLKKLNGSLPFGVIWILHKVVNQQRLKNCMKTTGTLVLRSVTNGDCHAQGV